MIVKFLLASGVKPTLRKRLIPLTGQFVLSPLMVNSLAAGVLEASIIPDSPAKVYFTVTQSASVNQIFMATAGDLQGAWTITPTAIIGLGAGGAPSNRQANSSCVFKANGYYYCTATNGYGSGAPGEDRDLYLYRSADGVTFTDLGKIIDKSAVSGGLGFGNSCVYPALVNGQYEMLLECMDSTGIWRIFRFSSTNIESGWTFTNAVPNLQVATGGMCGGMQNIYNNGTWHILYHYAPSAGNSPTWLGYATSPDLVTITKKEHPLFGIEISPYGPDTAQIADPFLAEVNGKCYMLAEYVDGVTNNSQLWLWHYDGTFNQLIANT